MSLVLEDPIYKILASYSAGSFGKVFGGVVVRYGGGVGWVRVQIWSN